MILLDQVNEVENLLITAQEEILKKFYISQQTLKQREILLIEKRLEHHVFMLEASARQRIKYKLSKQKQIDKLPATYELGQASQQKIAEIQQANIKSVYSDLEAKMLGQEGERKEDEYRKQDKEKNKQKKNLSLTMQLDIEAFLQSQQTLEEIRRSKAESTSRAFLPNSR